MSPNRGTGRGPNNPGGPQPGAPPPLNGHGVIRPVFANRMIPASGDGGCANPGLVFDRYLRIWHRDKPFSLLEGDRRKVLARFVQEYEECRPVLGPLLQETHHRLDGLSERLAVQNRTFSTQERLVSGLGAAHPLENGFAFDYSLGVPLLAGSSIKGLARQYSYYELKQTDIDRLFGPDLEGEQERSSDAAGDIVFFPAYPERWPQLEVDIINCHYQEYYAGEPHLLVNVNTESAPEAPRRPRVVGPIEYESPVPVFFLTVKKGTGFVFRCGSRSGDVKNVERALEIVAKGLSELGIGAKTALGYGVMK
jgi:CRISPR-associated protein Cmr6